MDRPSLSLVASTINPDGLPPLKKKDGASDRQSFFKSVQWSADGTTLFTSSFSNRICSFVLPETLLEPRQAPATLTAHATLALPEPTSAIAPCPYFALEHPSTQVLLTASTDHPIHLHHAFPPTSSSRSSSISSSPPSSSSSSPSSFSSDNSDSDSSLRTFTPSPSTPPPVHSKPLASFHLIKRETEAYLPIASLLWPRPGTHFVAGTANRIALFDVSRPDALSSAPVLSVPTIPSARHIAKGGGVGMRGVVAALSLSSSSSYASSEGGGGGWGGGGAGDGGLLAAGTWTRNIGLYDLMRSGGECVATWGVAGPAAEAGVGGKGVVQTLWSPCGRYLVVNERGATGLLVYDLRGTHRLLGWLEGRDGRTNQRLSCDVFPGSGGAGGFEVWAGTKDGGVVVWEGVGSQGGGVAPSWDWKAHGSAVGATAMHMSGSVVATCSGSWKIADDDDEDSSDDTDSSNSSDSSDSSDKSVSRTTTPRRSGANSRVVVEETSLKIWSVGPSNQHQAERDEQYEGDTCA